MIKQANATPRSVGNAILSVLFISIGVVSALRSEALEASAWLALGAALIVLGNEATPWNEIRLWRRVLGAALALGAVALIAANLWVDFTN